MAEAYRAESGGQRAESCGQRAESCGPDSHTQVSKDYGVYNPNQIDYVFHIYEQTFAQDKFSSSKLSLEALGLTFVVGRFALTATPR